MKTFKQLSLFVLALLTFNCSSDDDSSSGGTLTTAELLTSARWYLESKTPGDFTDCEKNTSFKFNTDNTVDVDSYEDDSGPCESQGVISSTYSLSGNTLTIDLGGDSITATINSISETLLNVTDDIGDTIVFDRTQG
nr:lipocalin family protein [uncultured Psychroserpens sp.]